MFAPTQGKHKTLSAQAMFFLSAFVPLWQKKVFFLPLLFALFTCSCGGTDDNADTEYIHQDSLSLIPYPADLEKREGCFRIDFETHLNFSPELEPEGNYLGKLIDSSSTFSLPRNSKTKIETRIIELKLVNDFPAELQNGEAYRLIIGEDKLQITALTPVGIMRGIQTIRQLFIPAFHSGEKRGAWYLPCLKIEDSPAFEHRGLLLDVCRHFFEKEVVLKYIDLLAYYKLNILHLHLTEDQGWRIQIDKYPKLNEISSWRKDTTGNLYGGFYTKDDLKEIVAYAAERHIIVIPEIELPGHSQAALAAYPKLSCTGGPIEVATGWGVFKEIYCAGNDSTFIFLEDVLTEVMEIFPSEYIHIGGDEAPKFRWEHCDKCQQRMKDEDLANEHELQSYFIERIEKFLNSKGRKLIGWDEILEGGLSENATVQSWRGMDGGLQAARDSHYVVMSPTSHCYLDYGLDAIDLRKVYAFNPVPAELEQSLHRFILGGECNMWTEHVPGEADLDSKVFPRLIALAERLWTNPEVDNFDDFYSRLQKHYPILKLFKIQYGIESIPATIKTTIHESGDRVISIKPNLDNIELKYKWECENCNDDFRALLEGEVKILDRSGNFIVKAYKNGIQYGDSMTIKVEKHLALSSDVTYHADYHAWYSASGDVALTDGVLGSENFRDGNWQGFWGVPAEIEIDLGEVKTINSIATNFFVYPDAWIMLPKLFHFSHSADGKNWTTCPVVMPAATQQFENSSKSYIQLVESFAKTPKVARYLKIRIDGYGKLPASHEAAGQDSWIFIDEIIVK